MNPGRAEAGIIAALIASAFVLYGLGAMLVLWIRDVRLRRLESQKDKRKHGDPGAGPTV